MCPWNWLLLSKIWCRSWCVEEPKQTALKPKDSPTYYRKLADGPKWLEVRWKRSGTRNESLPQFGFPPSGGRCARSFLELATPPAQLQTLRSIEM
ncbi:uncharacterized protein F5Z01DRAFT_667959, partial [Emericellopsis atlantica]